MQTGVIPPFVCSVVTFVIRWPLTVCACVLTFCPCLAAPQWGNDYQRYRDSQRPPWAPPVRRDHGATQRHGNAGTRGVEGPVQGIGNSPSTNRRYTGKDGTLTITERKQGNRNQSVYHDHRGRKVGGVISDRDGATDRDRAAHRPETRVYYDRNGSFQMIEKRDGGSENRTFYDKSGRKIGGYVDEGNLRKYYDKNGTLRGLRIRKENRNNYNFHDPSGAKVGSSIDD